MTSNNPQSSRHSTEYISLRDYFEALLTERDKAIQIALAEQAKRQEAQDRAVGVALVAQDKHLSYLNEFKATFEQQNLMYLTKAEHSAFRSAIDSDIRSLRESRALLEGKASQTSVDIVAKSASNARTLAITGTMVGIAGFILSLVSFFIR